MFSYLCFKLIAFSEDSYASGKIKFWAGLIGILGIYPATMLDISIIIFGALLFLKIIGG